MHGLIHFLHGYFGVDCGFQASGSLGWRLAAGPLCGFSRAVCFLRMLLQASAGAGFGACAHIYPQLRPQNMRVSFWVFPNETAQKGRVLPYHKIKRYPQSGSGTGVVLVSLACRGFYASDCVAKIFQPCSRGTKSPVGWFLRLLTVFCAPPARPVLARVWRLVNIVIHNFTHRNWG